MHFRSVLVVLSLAALASCAAPPVSTATLRPARQVRELVFDHDFLYTNSKPSSVQRYVGLLAGTFGAAYEDDEGIYYRSQGPLVVWAANPEQHIQYLAEGGVWISNASDSHRFKIFRIIGTEIQRSTDTGATAKWSATGGGSAMSTTGNQFAVNQVLSGQSPVVAGVGSAVGTAILQKLIELDQGKIKFDRDDPPANVKLVGAYRETTTDK